MAVEPIERIQKNIFVDWRVFFNGEGQFYDHFAERLFQRFCLSYYVIVFLDNVTPPQVTDALESKKSSSYATEIDIDNIAKRTNPTLWVYPRGAFAKNLIFQKIEEKRDLFTCKIRNALNDTHPAALDSLNDMFFLHPNATTYGTGFFYAGCVFGGTALLFAIISGPFLPATSCLLIFAALIFTAAVCLAIAACFLTEHIGSTIEAGKVRDFIETPGTAPSLVAI